MADQIREYMDARSDFEAANGLRKKMTLMIMEVARALETNPMRTSFADTNTPMPFEASMAQNSLVFPGKEWPSADQIQKMLAGLHNASHQLDEAWRRIPASDKASLQPPSDVY